jgi:histidyl-tRNA synthetase
MEPLARRRAEREGIVERIVELVGGGPDEAGEDDLLADPGDGSSLPGLLREFGPEGAARVTADLLRRANVALEAGTRTPQEIVERLLVKAGRDDPTRQVRSAAAFIVRLNELAGPPQAALPALAELLREHALDPAPLREVEAALKLFGAHGGRADNVTVDLSLGRGLRYYTGLVFEVYYDEPGGPLQLCGGGRYDELVRALGGRESVPACGFSFGLERLKLALDSRAAGEGASSVDLLMAPLGAEDLPLAAELAERLRDAGLRVEVDIKLRGARGNLRHADRAGIPLVALVGEQERAQGRVVLRQMASRREQSLPLETLVSTARAALRVEAPVGRGDGPA